MQTCIFKHHALLYRATAWRVCEGITHEYALQASLVQGINSHHPAFEAKQPHGGTGVCQVEQNKHHIRDQ